MFPLSNFSLILLPAFKSHKSREALLVSKIKKKNQDWEDGCRREGRRQDSVWLRERRDSVWTHWRQCLWVEEQLYSRGLWGTAGHGSPDRAASTDAGIPPGATGSDAETGPSWRGEWMFSEAWNSWESTTTAPSKQLQTREHWSQVERTRGFRGTLHPRKGRSDFAWDKVRTVVQAGEVNAHVGARGSGEVSSQKRLQLLGLAWSANVEGDLKGC